MFQCLSVDLACKMHRAFAIDRIPAGGIGAAEKLHLQTDTDGGCFYGQPDDALRRLPGRAAGRPALHNNRVDFSVADLNVEFRRAKAFFIITQAALPGKTASGGGANDTFFENFFS